MWLYTGCVHWMRRRIACRSKTDYQKTQNHTRKAFSVASILFCFPAWFSWVTRMSSCFRASFVIDTGPLFFERYLPPLRT